MSEFHRRGDESEGRSASRIDLQEGGRYLSIPPRRCLFALHGPPNSVYVYV